MDIKQKIEAVFNALQELNIKPTPHNVSLLSGVYNLLREAYVEAEKHGNTDQAGG